MSQIPARSMAELLADYQTLLLDAYGVLLDKGGPLPGAARLLERLHGDGRSYLVLSNSASRLPETMAAELAALGLPVPAERILTSGMLLDAWVERRGLAGSRCLVLGPADSWRYVERAGLRPVSPQEDPPDAEAILVADQKGFDCLAGMDAALTLALRRLDAGRSLHLVLCNPDLIYPVAPGRYGFTAGGLAAMLGAVLEERYPGSAPRFERLGKPHGPMFEEARRRSGPGRAIMVGDQLATDILGANRFGIDSALVATGLSPVTAELEGDFRPSCRLTGLDPDA